MKQSSDEEIQKILDDEGVINPTVEGELYQKVYNELSKIPDFAEDDLVQDVVLTIHHQTERRSAFLACFAVGLSLLAVLLLFFAVTYYVDSFLATKIFHVLWSLKWVVLFLLLMLSVILIPEGRFFSNYKKGFKRKKE